MVGNVLGNRYRVLREIGSGGMAWVYLAEDVNEGCLVAVKVLYPQFGEDVSYIHRFNREAKLASAMTDSHIVRVLDYGADRDIYYLVMEYIEGRDLRELLAEHGPYPWRTALDIVDQLASALEHAHIHGVVHRDIKPQNMMLDDNGLLKVFDFGIARISTLPNLTQSGFIGSPYYVSPEQAMSETVDIRSDIYSAGIVLYEILSGNVPFDAKSPWSIISQHIANDPPPLQLNEDDVPESLHELLAGMVAKTREDRFQTPTGMRRAIAAVLEGKPLPEQSNVDTRPIGTPDQVELAESLFNRALEAIEAEEWGRASDLLNQTLKLDPDHAQALEKLDLAEHNNTLLSNYNTAIRAMDRKDWLDGIKKFEAVIKVDPDFKDAKEQLESCHQAYEKENAEQLTTELYVEGVSHFDTGRLDEAAAAFGKVQRLSPGYKRVDNYLEEVQRRTKSAALEQEGKSAVLLVTLQSWGRWALGRWAFVGVGLIAIVAAFVFFGNRNAAIGDGDVKTELKVIYGQAQAALETGDTEQALDLLQQILDQDPDYADAAELRRDLVLSLTPTPATSQTDGNPLASLLTEAERAVEIGQWSEATDALTEIRSAAADFEENRVSSLFCDAYIGRGMDTLKSVGSADQPEVDVVQHALADFEAGATECPRRIDLQDQAQRAMTYLELLTDPPGEADAVIKALNPIVAPDPEYVNGNAKQRLYEAYLKRGNARFAAGETAGALGDYEAAVALGVADPGEAQTRRAELILAIQQNSQQQPVAQLAEGTLEPTPTPSNPDSPNGDDPATPSSVPVTLSKPALLEPAEDEKFAGKFAEVFVEWQSIQPLAGDEYYDLTVMHLFDDQPQYWGTATRETRVQLSPDIGLGVAGNDRFYWWVTIRKENTAPSPESLDLPRSPQSEARSFVWLP